VMKTQQTQLQWFHSYICHKATNTVLMSWVYHQSHLVVSVAYFYCPLHWEHLRVRTGRSSSCYHGHCSTHGSHYIAKVSSKYLLHKVHTQR
jgi:hypothetical protein